MEQRKAQRIETDIQILLTPIGENHTEHDPIRAEVIDVSKCGIGFCTETELEDHTFYQARLVFQSKESVSAIIEIMRHNKKMDAMNFYGGQFVGMSENDQFKIEVFRLFAEQTKASVSQE